MPQNKPPLPSARRPFILPLYGLLLVGLLLAWLQVPNGISISQAEVNRSVVTQFQTAILNNPIYLLLRPRAPIDLANQVSVIATNSSKPAAPIQLLAIDQKIGQTITLTWEPAEGEQYTAYSVYRSITGESVGQVIASNIQTTTYTDTSAANGVAYYYTVQGIGNTDAAVSEPSRAAIGTATDSIPPHAPTHLLAKNTGDGKTIQISWTNPVDQDFVSVRIYRSTALGQLGTLIADGVIASEYLDTTIPDNNVPVYYTVTSLDTLGNESPSTLKTTTPGNTNPFQVLY